MHRLLGLLALISFVHCQLNCDILDPECRALYRWVQRSTRENKSKNAGRKTLKENILLSRSGTKFNDIRRKAKSKCDYQDVWLIPGRADTSCTRPGARRLLEISAGQIHIKPELVRLPGCFTLEIKSLRVKDDANVVGNSFFAKAEYQWWNVKDFSNLKCQNASSNGCGGYGNNCYYCDVCHALTEIDHGDSGMADSIANQLRGIKCPKRPGYYTFRKSTVIKSLAMTPYSFQEFCFNDWTAFDTDGDCEMDFLQGDRGDYRSALSSLQQVGHGSVIAKVRLAFNATGAIERKRLLKEAQIEDTVAKELEERRRTWDVNNGQFDKFSQWYIEYRKNIWHKYVLVIHLTYRDDYLPWLLYENEIACLKITFDVCEKPPRRINYSGRVRYTCEN
ncbi:unnamed protein product [Angiostrongylus costaricensis]|uniref:DUF7753 domain-containing protein n=1 Tax=Angiostrongylus costaricensis TaxID=334426 RepID=A0A0R3PAH7_ANGCS|nr:unnamed protein product [Angiostrongylus costaricensis]